MSKKYIVWAVLVAAVIVITFLVVSVFVKTASESDKEAAEQSDLSEAIENPFENNASSGTLPAAEVGLLPSAPSVAPVEYKVIYSNNAFSPSSLVIKEGDRVTFYNVSGDFLWPASDLHPTHKGYPGSDIKKCGTAEAADIFDACRQMLPGESWSFTFKEAGSWSYHNHLRSSESGVVIVEN